MDTKIFFLILSAVVALSHGDALTNYDISRNRLGDSGAGYGQYHPGGQYQGGQYPGNYPGQYPQGPGLYPSGSGYPGHYGPAGPPGAHPGCPLCDSSVYSYCSHKQAHDSCCCGNAGYLPFGCRKSDCNFLYANSCDEFQLISNCCCVDLHKNAVASPADAPVAA